MKRALLTGTLLIVSLAALLSLLFIGSRDEEGWRKIKGMSESEAEAVLIGEGFQYVGAITTLETHRWKATKLWRRYRLSANVHLDENGNVASWSAFENQIGETWFEQLKRWLSL